MHRRICTLFVCIYSAGEEKSPYFLFHGETALRKILKFQGETANFSEKFQGEITEFLRENMELYRQNLKISGRNTGISWRKYWISWRNLEKFSTISPSFSKKKRQLIMEKNKKWGFLFTCTVAKTGFLMKWLICHILFTTKTHIWSVFWVCMKKLWVLGYLHSTKQRLINAEILFAVCTSFEPPHDKTNKMTCTQQRLISMGMCPVWSVFAVHMKKPLVLSYPTQIRLGRCQGWSFAGRTFSWFCHIPAHVRGSYWTAACSMFCTAVIRIALVRGFVF